MNIEAKDNFGDADRVRDARAKLNLALQAVEGEVPATFDRRNAFLVYASMSGDSERTAMALGISHMSLERLIVEEGWDDKIASLIKLRKSGNAKQVERGVNRALNFIQAQRLRMILERLMRRLDDMTDDELMDYSFASTTKTDKNGETTIEKKFNARPFADLASAMEKTQVLSYMALADTAAERKKHGPTDAEIHSTIANAISKMNTEPAGPAGQAIEGALQAQGGTVSLK
jgi:hypothetical protein